MTDPLARELLVAREAARLAGDYLLAEYAAFTPIPDAPADLSTHADRGSQELILGRLRAAFPADGLLAEEATLSVPGSSGRVWVVDPIDGTRGFATKTGQWSVMIGLAVAGESVLGVVAEPVQGRTTFATRTGGCWVQHNDADPLPCRVSDTAPPAGLTLARSVGRAGKPTLGERLLAPAATIVTHSAGVKLALVARGEADVYVNDHAGFCDWDVCAGHILVEAAGGRVTGFAGQVVGYGPGGPRRTCGLVASNGRVHDAVVAALAGATQ